jgi:signal transduction histidine kinase
MAHWKLNETHHSLLQAEKMAVMGTLVAGICHNLNNPIAGMKICLRRIAQDPEYIAQSKKYLPIMTEALDSAANILRELLAFARKEEVVYEPIDLRQTIVQVIESLSCEMEDYKIAFTKHFDHDLQLVLGNPSQLAQVIFNLVMNSIDAIKQSQEVNPDKMGEIIFLLNMKSNQLHLSIADNGIGIEAEKLPDIFDPFFTTKKKKRALDWDLHSAPTLSTNTRVKLLLLVMKMMD